MRGVDGDVCSWQVMMFTVLAVDPELAAGTLDVCVGTELISRE